MKIWKCSYFYTYLHIITYYTSTIPDKKRKSKQSVICKIDLKKIHFKKNDAALGIYEFDQNKSLFLRNLNLQAKKKIIENENRKDINENNKIIYESVKEDINNYRIAIDKYYEQINTHYNHFVLIEQNRDINIQTNEKFESIILDYFTSSDFNKFSNSIYDEMSYFEFDENSYFQTQHKSNFKSTKMNFFGELFSDNINLKCFFPPYCEFKKNLDSVKMVDFNNLSFIKIKKYSAALNFLSENCIKYMLLNSIKNQNLAFPQNISQKYQKQ